MIRLENVTAGYYGRAIVKGITLDILPGQVLVLLGPNGSGKSTLLKASLGLLPLLEGRVLYDDMDLKKLSRKQAARKAAYLTQSRNTPSIKALNMVLHGRFPYLSYPRRYGKEDYEIAGSAMLVTGSREHENTNVSELSGGQRQGVYLAMALAQCTETVFMDEPTTYLDISHQLKIMETARGLAGAGKAVVLVLHDIPLALRTADRVAVLDRGELRCLGTPEQIFQSSILDQVFGVSVRRMETPDGLQYYCI